MGAVLLLHVTVLLTSQASPPAAVSTPEERATRLQTMTEIAKSYRLRPLGDRFATHPLRPEPVHRFSNTVGQTRDGSIFVWTLGETGRPAVAAPVFETREDGG